MSRSAEWTWGNQSNWRKLQRGWCGPLLSAQPRLEAPAGHTFGRRRRRRRNLLALATTGSRRWPKAEANALTGARCLPLRGVSLRPGICRREQLCEEGAAACVLCKSVEGKVNAVALGLREPAGSGRTLSVNAMSVRRAWSGIARCSPPSTPCDTRRGERGRLVNTRSTAQIAWGRGGQPPGRGWWASRSCARREATSEARSPVVALLCMPTVSSWCRPRWLLMTMLLRGRVFCAWIARTPGMMLVASLRGGANCAPTGKSPRPDPPIRGGDLETVCASEKTSCVSGCQPSWAAAGPGLHPERG